MATIAEPALYIGVMVLGAVGTGRTSACMYAYVDQFLRWRTADSDLKVGGVVLEVKGDFWQQVLATLIAAGRGLPGLGLESRTAASSGAILYGSAGSSIHRGSLPFLMLLLCSLSRALAAVAPSRGVMGQVEFCTVLFLNRRVFLDKGDRSA